jgi:hypothetical protein
MFWLDTFLAFIVFEKRQKDCQFWKGDKGLGFKDILFIQKLFWKGGEA